MLSSTAEYALRVIAHLAGHAPPPAKAFDIAAATKVPSGYAAKILQDLTKAGLVQSQRGPKGGFVLARDPSEITVLQVISAVDPIRRITACPLGKRAHAHKLCRLHQRLDDAFAAVERSFGESTIADLCGTGGLGGLCAVQSKDPRMTPLTHAGRPASAVRAGDVGGRGTGRAPSAGTRKPVR